MSHQEGRTALTDLYLFPLAFCCHRWAENLHCRDSIGFWPMLQKYVDTVHIERLPNPPAASFETTKAALQDSHLS